MPQTRTLPLPGPAAARRSSLLLIAGPCVVESKEILFETAEMLAAACRESGITFVLKSSYRKANRTRIHSFKGIGDEKALMLLREAADRYEVPVTTDIHTAEEAAMAARYVDVLQIPAFLCRQTDLLQAAAATGKVVNIKKGQFLSPDAMQHAVEKVRQSGNQSVWLTERGTTFGYQDLVVDFRSIPIMQSFGVPVILDCTHSVQQPNQANGVTGGTPRFISTLAYAGLAAGADGLFLETHPEPSKALSDGANMLPLSAIPGLLRKLTLLWETCRTLHALPD